MTQSTDAIVRSTPLGFSWPTLDPFLFCVHHNDHYPAGTSELGPAPSSLQGRDIGQDFSGKDGFSMYHGHVVPGFPKHPHRGFETVTIVRQGLLDHTDSMGAGARYGGGDVQWLTAGKGIQHAEMFPLLHADRPNPVELFQIWLNLPKVQKFAEPHFTMFWHERIPIQVFTDRQGKKTEVAIIAGAIAEQPPLAPPPESWAAQASSDVAIWTIKMEAASSWTLPKAQKGSHRMLYFFAGQSLRVGEVHVSSAQGLQLHAHLDVTLQCGAAPAEMLLLQGRPIGEQVARHGPFVMNTPAEIQQAFMDYQHTQFGGWSWPHAAPVHPQDAGRFARFADGRVERPT